MQGLNLQITTQGEILGSLYFMPGPVCLIPSMAFSSFPCVCKFNSLYKHLCQQTLTNNMVGSAMKSWPRLQLFTDPPRAFQKGRFVSQMWGLSSGVLHSLQRRHHYPRQSILVRGNRSTADVTRRKAVNLYSIRIQSTLGIYKIWS